MSKNKQLAPKSKRKIISSLNSKRKTEKCFYYALKAYDSEDYEAVFDYAMQGLRGAPKSYELYELALKAVVELQSSDKTYSCLKHAWRHELIDSKQNLLVFGQLAVYNQEYTLAEQALKALLYNSRDYSGRLTKEKRKIAEQCLDRVKFNKFEQEIKEEKSAKTKKSRSSSDKQGSDQKKQAKSQVIKNKKEDNTLEESVPKLQVNFNIDSSQLDEVLEKNQVVDPETFQLALWSYRLSFRSSYDQLLCLPWLSNVQSLWFQEETARKVMKNLRGRAILADEVGLGKTIEACLVLKEYIMRGLVRNVLILVPSALVNQWQAELEDKFGLSFISSNDLLFKQDPESFWKQNYLLVSIQTARMKRHFDKVTVRSYDMVIVDEGHHLKNRNTRNWKLINAIHKSYLLLLTATPVQNKLEELYNLITLLKPGHLSTVKDFKNRFVARGDPTNPQNREKLRYLLKEVMVRNTRSVAQVKLPPRYANTVRVEPWPEEKEFYTLISQFVTDKYQEGSQDISKMTLRGLLQVAGSSHFAALKMLERLKEQSSRDVQDGVDELIEKSKQIGTSSKARRVLDLIKTSKEQKIVFVNYQNTLRYLEELFQRNHISHVVFKGGMSPEKKKKAITDFQQGCPLMLSMDSGGEGHNLQFCRMIINYDLPWNPMQIEQRIGRLHRIGQQKEVFIYNFCATGSLEDHILDILDRKINMFELVIGEMEMILGRLQGEQEFGELVYKLWAENSEIDDKKKAFESLGSKIKRAKTAHEKSKELDEKLFQDDFGV